jgi:alkyl hydroperoxide reductase subunit AhpC
MASHRQVCRIGAPAPNFHATAVVGTEFKEIDLASYRGEKFKTRLQLTLTKENTLSFFSILLVCHFFTPFAKQIVTDFTFVCPTEIIAFSESAKAFHDIGCEFLGVSVDSKFTHLAWINTPRKEGGIGKINFPLVSDITKQISRDYDVLIEEGGDNGVSLRFDHNYTVYLSIILRGTFIIDKKGILRQITKNDLPIGRSVDETLRLVQAVQFTDEHGDQVCPMNWKPGAATMTPDPVGSKKYFGAHN